MPTPTVIDKRVLRQQRELEDARHDRYAAQRWVREFGGAWCEAEGDKVFEQTEAEPT